MSDHFEKAMQNIATRSAENGGPTITDVLTALVAENDDAEERHTETKLALKGLAADGITCDSRISTLEKWHEVFAQTESGQDAARFRAAGLARGVISDAADTAAAQTVQTAETAALALAASSRQTWAMWGISTTLLREIALPILVVFLTIYVTGKL